MDIRAVLYVRQSLDVQVGIDRQLALTRQLADKRGWTIVAEYEDNDTSATKYRGVNTGWGRMLKSAKDNEFTHVVAVNLDRLIRTQADLIKLVDLGVKIVTVDGEVDLSSAEGEFRAVMLTAVARFEVKRKAERMERAVREKIAAGVPFTAKRPFGYERDMITLRPAEAVPLAEAIHRVIGRDSVHSIARWLNDTGVLTTTGKRWSTTQLKKVLLRERNAGRLVRHKEVIEPSAIQQVVSPSDFDLAKAILTAPDRGLTAGPKPELNWLSGIMTCGECGARITQKSITGVGRTYICSVSAAGTAVRGSRHVTILASIAERKVRDEVIAWASKPRGNEPDNAVELRTIEAELQELEADRVAASEALLIRNVAKAPIQGRLDQIDAQVEKLTSRRASVSIAGSRLPDIQNMVPSEVLNTTKGVEVHTWSAGQAWWATAPVEQRRNIIRDGFTIKVMAGGKGARRVLVTPR
jgi:site-specific DNA recombinase